MDHWECSNSVQGNTLSRYLAIKADRFEINFRLWGPTVPFCNARQRLAGYVFGAGSVVNSALNWLGYIGLPLALLAGYPFVVYYERWQLAWLLRLVCIWIFADTAHKMSLALFVGYRDAMRWDGDQRTWAEAFGLFQPLTCDTLPTDGLDTRLLHSGLHPRCGT